MLSLTLATAVLCCATYWMGLTPIPPIFNAFLSVFRNTSHTDSTDSATQTHLSLVPRTKQVK